MIRLEGVGVHLPQFALREINFVVPARGHGLIIGPTGSGKTTLLEMIAGHLPLASGRIFLRGHDVAGIAPEARRVGIVYQHYHLFPHYTVRENIWYGLTGPGRGRPVGPAHARIADLADRLGIGHLLDRTVTGLSGGEQQRIALARALAPAPDILLLDEPFSAVDPTTRRAVRAVLQSIHEQEPITILQVTHDFEDALRWGDVVAILHEGTVAQAGRPDDVFRYPNSPEVARFVGTGNLLAGVIQRREAADPEMALTFPALFRVGRLVLELVADREGPAHIILRPEDLVVGRAPHLGSARNRFGATIVRRETVGPITYLHVDAGEPLTAAITTTTADEMQYRTGEVVQLAIKATAIHII